VVIRYDGPELVSLTLAQCAEEHGVMLEIIMPGKPTQNALLNSSTGRTGKKYWIFICSEP
jgi:hypothetical protein